MQCLKKKISDCYPLLFDSSRLYSIPKNLMTNNIFSHTKRNFVYQTSSILHEFFDAYKNLESHRRSRDIGIVVTRQYFQVTNTKSGVKINETSISLPPQSKFVCRKICASSRIQCSASQEFAKNRWHELGESSVARASEMSDGTRRRTAVKM